MVIHGKSEGGQSPCGIAFWEAGRGSAPMLKSWFEAIEARNNPNTAFTVFRGVLENHSSIVGKREVRNAVEKVPKARRKEKVKKLRTVHFKRDGERGAYGGCANCLGTGLEKNNKAKYPDNDTGVAVGFLLGGAPQGPCSVCGGEGKNWRRPWEKKNEENGWFGFIAEEIEQEFPEAVFYREDEDGVVRPSGLDSLAMIAILWEEVKDLEDRLAGVEHLPVIVMNQPKRNA